MRFAAFGQQCRADLLSSASHFFVKLSLSSAHVANAACRQALLHSRATVIQRYFRGFITRLRTVDALRQLQVRSSACQRLTALATVTKTAGLTATVGVRYISGPCYRVPANGVPARHHHVRRASHAPLTVFPALLLLFLSAAPRCRFVVTASSDEFAPQSRSGNRALEVSLAEELIKLTGDQLRT